MGAVASRNAKGETAGPARREWSEVKNWILVLLLFAIPLAAQQQPPVFDKKFVALNSGYLTSALIDSAITQDCIRAGTCVEGNPWAPKSAWGQAGLAVGMAGATTFVSYEMKKHGSRLWWLPPTVGIAGHVVGAGSGMRYAVFQWRFVLP